MKKRLTLPDRASAFAVCSILAVSGPLALAQDSSSATESDDEIVYLSPFEVSTESSSRYLVTDTLAGNRIRTDLKDVGSAISVYNKQFMDDIGATNAEELLVFATSAEVGGAAGNFQGGGNEGSVPDESDNLARPQTNNRVRGLASADNTRDFMLTDIPWDSYNVSRIDVQRGANAILFGNGSPAGIINGDVDDAVIGGNHGMLEARYGSYDSMRASINANYTLLDDELAVRVAGLYDHKNYRQHPAYNLDRRQYVAVRYDPKWLRVKNARTSIKASYEKGKIEANRPRTLTPIDCITPWFTSTEEGGLGKRTYDTTEVYVLDDDDIAADPEDYSLGARQAGTTNYEPWISTLASGPVAYIDTDNSTTYVMASASQTFGIDSSGEVDGSIDGLVSGNLSIISNYADYATAADLEYQELGVYKVKGLSDSSIYNFYTQLLDGNTKREWANFDASKISLEQTFFDGMAGFEVVVDHQSYDDGHTQVLNSSSAITVDINETLTDGSANPNVGRACVVSNSQSNYASERDRDTVRATVFAEIDAKNFLDSGSWLTRILGRHRFTGMYQHYKFKQSDMSWVRYTTADNGILAYISSDTLAVNNSSRYLTMVYYLSDYIGDADSASGLHLSNIKQDAEPDTSGSILIYDSTYNSTTKPILKWTRTQTQSENPDNYVGWTNMNYELLSADSGDIDQLITNVSGTSVETDSWVAVWQGYMFDECLVPMIGYRWDKTTSSSVAYGSNDDGTVAYDDVTYTELTNNWQGMTWSWVAHVPEKWTSFIPGKIKLSFYMDRSKNFQPSSRVDLSGSQLAPPTGKTREYGFMVSALEDRISLRLGHYVTDVNDASLTDFPNSWYFANMWTWEANYASQAYDYYYNNDGDFRYQSADSIYTQDENDAIGKAAVDAFYTSTAEVYEKFPGLLQAFGVDYDEILNHEQLSSDASKPSNLAITGDTRSEGWEAELFMRITDNWNVSLNVTKTDAMRINMAQSVKDFMEYYWEQLNGDLGDLRTFTSYYVASNTAKAWFQRKLWSPYCLYLLQEGSNVPELRKWAFNVVTNYNFDKGFLKGLNTGLGYRWQDKQIIGYPVLSYDEDSGEGEYDLDNPYYGPSLDRWDAWVGYTRALTDKVTWKIQVNVRNLVNDTDLIPVTCEPDGTTATYRIPDGRTWEITSTFTF